MRVARKALGTACDFTIAGPDKGEGGKYLLLPPGYQNEPPMAMWSFGSNPSATWSSDAASYGIQKGKPFAPDERMRKIYDRSRRGRSCYSRYRLPL